MGVGHVSLHLWVCVVVCVCRLDQIMGFKAGNLRANMYFYKIIGEKAPNNAVVMYIYTEPHTHTHTHTHMQYIHAYTCIQTYIH